MYCLKWKDDIAHCVFILSHLPFEDCFVSDYDQKGKYTSSFVANLFNKLETQVVHLFVRK